MSLKALYWVHFSIAFIWKTFATILLIWDQTFMLMTHNSLLTVTWMEYLKELIWWTLNSDPERLFQWAERKSLKINPQKSLCMGVSRNRFDCSIIPTIRICNDNAANLYSSAYIAYGTVHYFFSWKRERDWFSAF